MLAFAIYTITTLGSGYQRGAYTTAWWVQYIVPIYPIFIFGVEETGTEEVIRAEAIVLQI